MIAPLPGGAYVNVAHISMISGVQKAPNRPNVYTLKILLMGTHHHEVLGTEQEVTQLHKRLKNAIDQLDPGVPHE